MTPRERAVMYLADQSDWQSGEEDREALASIIQDAIDDAVEQAEADLARAREERDADVAELIHEEGLQRGRAVTAEAQLAALRGVVAGLVEAVRGAANCPCQHTIYGRPQPEQCPCGPCGCRAALAASEKAQQI